MLDLRRNCLAKHQADALASHQANMLPRHSPRITMPGVLVCLSAFAPSAAAECAWVLWSEESALKKGGAAQDLTTSPWVPVDGSSSETGGRRSMKENIEEAHRRWSKPANKFVGWADRYVFTIDDESAPRVHVTLRCLPDSVDPRGPKGK